ncbi:hypothetical protein EMGBS15_06930 [Filimonas sp.]|nr:hypothetical protein EMGBS15_06930 [Filimonas sp.]
MKKDERTASRIWIRAQKSKQCVATASLQIAKKAKESLEKLAKKMKDSAAGGSAD